jgi:hypothetical protein
MCSENIVIPRIIVIFILLFKHINEMKFYFDKHKNNRNSSLSYDKSHKY